MSIYPYYKPLRNFLREFSVEESLRAIWAYAQRLQFAIELPNEIQIDSIMRLQPRLGYNIVEWELETLAKEVIINGKISGRTSFKEWESLRKGINLLRRLEDLVVQHPPYRDLYEKRILNEIYRVAHRQFPWQRRLGTFAIGRYYRLFNTGNLPQIVERKIGLSLTDLYVIGILFFGVSLRHPAQKTPPQASIAGITPDKLQLFLDRYSCTLSEVRVKLIDAQSYDTDFAYALNPLKIYPLVLFGDADDGRVVIPLPTNLVRRFTEGLYYEVCGETDFGDAFGKAFESLVGDIIKAANSNGYYEVFSEVSYYVGSNRKDSVDWLIQDASASMFIECKTKKVTWASKIALTDMGPLESDLKILSEAIVQAYKSLSDALNGHFPNWKSDGRPIYVSVVLLEEWYAFGGPILSSLNAHVERGLSEASLDLNLTKKFPYAIFSLDEFEALIQIFPKTSIRGFFDTRFSGDLATWGTHSVLVNKYKEHYNSIMPSITVKDFESLADHVRST